MTYTKSTEKPSATTAANRQVALIDESTIRRLDDEQTDADGCRFAAVARSLESTTVPGIGIEFPTTRVAYVDASGEYGIEREFPGHRASWAGIPRTVVVTDLDAPSRIPQAHTEVYAPIIEAYERVLSEE